MMMRPAVSSSRMVTSDKITAASLGADDSKRQHPDRPYRGKRPRALGTILHRICNCLLWTARDKPEECRSVVAAEVDVAEVEATAGAVAVVGGEVRRERGGEVRQRQRLQPD